MNHEHPASEADHLVQNHYQSNISDFSELMEEDLKFEAFKLLWISAALNARVGGLDSAKEDEMIRALLGLKEYRSPAKLAQFIDLHVENIASTCWDISELYPPLIQQRYLKQGTEKGIVIGWIEMNLRRVAEIIRRIDRFVKSKLVWLDRASVERRVQTEVLGTVARE